MLKCKKTRKRCFETKLDAELMLSRLNQRQAHYRKHTNSFESKVYQCPFCNFWHLTKQAQNN